jgi:PhoPQ-activated pathogenicity-related protein
LLWRKLGRFWKYEISLGVRLMHRVFSMVKVLACLAGISIVLVSSTLSYASHLQEYVQETVDVSWQVKSSSLLFNKAWILQPLSFPLLGRVYELEVVSGTWQDYTWKHRVEVIIPLITTRKDMAVMYITGSGKGEDERLMLGMLARDIRGPVVILRDVPNQPLFDNLKEDRLIAYTFDQYLKTQDPTWPLLLPMTRSAVAAMTAVQEFLLEKNIADVKGFVVGGGSKRGWTTWLTAAVDDRVKGIFPMVYDNLDLQGQMAHQMEVWGSYSEQIADYVRLGLTDIARAGEGRELMTMVDPYAYIDSFTMPKLIIIGTNDPYWPIDASSLYFDDLPGRNYMFCIPNVGHSLGDYERIISMAGSLFMFVRNELDFPKLEWEVTEHDTSVIITVKGQPTNAVVQLWAAESDKRDFRKSEWQVVDEKTRDNVKFEINRPESGYKAVFAEIRFKIKGRTLYLSTQPYVISK